MFGRRGFLASLVASLFAPLANASSDTVRPSWRLWQDYLMITQPRWIRGRSETLDVSGASENGRTTLKICCGFNTEARVELFRELTIGEVAAIAKDPEAVWAILKAEERYDFDFSSSAVQRLQVGAAYFGEVVQGDARGDVGP